MRPRADDTIAAVATAAGPAGIGIVRISGATALAVGGRIFQGRRGRRLDEAPPFRLCLGIAAHPETGEQLDQVLAVWMPEGRSYTGEPTVEIHAHGGRAVLEAILRASFLAGARPAAPGEFTKRAFLSGRLDLSQAEAVAELIAAESEDARRLALQHLQGALASRVDGIRARLLDLLSGAEALLDFGDEDAPGGEPPPKELVALASELRGLAAAGGGHDGCGRGVHVVIAGRTNVGKSSIFNVLLDSERSIVTPCPGTTRDFVTERAVIGGASVTLVDTAGLRETADPVEAEGIARSHEMIGRADVLVLLVDGSEDCHPDDLRLIDELRCREPLVVMSKSDLPPRIDLALMERHCAALPCLAVSVRSGDGLPQFLAALAARCGSARPDPRDTVAPNARQQDALVRAAASLEDAGSLIASGERSLDLAAAEMKTALEAIDEITGKSAGDEIVELIFSRFCVGK